MNEDIERRISRLEDRIKIERLQSEYWDYLDTKQWDKLEQCFSTDFTFENKTTNSFYKGPKGMVDAMRKKFDEGVTTSHHGHHHWIDFVDDTHAIGHWALEDDLYNSVGGGEFKGRAHYDNTYLKEEDGSWKCSSMKLTYLRGEGTIKKRLDKTAEAYKVFLM